MDADSTESQDSFCKKLLETGDPKEVREWIRDESNTLGELDHQDSVALADDIYMSGATHVYAVEIYEEDGNTGRLVIELPSNTADRKRVLDSAAKIAHEQGFDAETNVGQRYVFVMLD